LWRPRLAPVGQVDPAHVQLGVWVLRQDLGAGLLALGERADSHHDACPGTGEAPGGFLARATVGAGHDRELPTLVRDDVHDDSSIAS
jgi:hypothetical protein